MVKNLFFVVPLFFIALIGFMPKEEIYYKLEAELKQKGIVINEGNLKESFFTLDIEDAEVFTKGMRVAHIEKLSLFTVLFYSHLSIENLHTNKSMAALIPKSVEVAKVTHAIWKPKEATLSANGSFGHLEGKIDGMAKSVRVDFNETKGDFKKIKRYLKREGNRWYYETNF
jgi:hypothetical protein